MLFIPVALTFIALLQWAFHRRLSPLLPPALGRRLVWIQAALHLPLLVYMGLRLSGHGWPWLLRALRPASRVTLYLQVVALIFLAWDLLARLAWRIGRTVIKAAPEAPPDEARRSFLRKAALLGTGAAAASSALGAHEAYEDPVLTRLRVAFPDLPQGLDGLRIAFLSDLHAGPLVRPAQLRRWRDLTEREKPELILYGGDFVDSRPEEIALFVDAFGDLHAPLGRFGVLGNHDFFDDPVRIWGALEAMGVRCLENAHAVIERGGARLALVGLQDGMALNGRFRRVRFGPGPLVAPAIAGLASEPFRLGLIHAPNHWNLAREAGARFTLAGHTHGGQINLIPGLSSARIIGPYTAGLYEEGGDRLYVGRGLGVVGIPLRVGAPPELVIVTLVRG